MGHTEGEVYASDRKPHCVFRQGNKELVCQCYGSIENGGPEPEDDARELARRWNAHPALLAACEAAQGALIALTTGAGSPTPAVVEGRAALQAVNAALAAAR